MRKYPRSQQRCWKAIVPRRWATEATWTMRAAALQTLRSGASVQNVLGALLGEAGRVVQADAARGASHEQPLASDVPAHGGGRHSAVGADTPDGSRDASEAPEPDRTCCTRVVCYVPSVK